MSSTTRAVSPTGSNTPAERQRGATQPSGSRRGLPPAVVTQESMAYTRRDGCRAQESQPAPCGSWRKRPLASSSLTT